MLTSFSRPVLQTVLWLALLSQPAFLVAETWQLETREVPFDYTSSSVSIEYEPLAEASRPWQLCVSYPHLKDSYWLSVNYGMAEEARRLGVSFRLVEAGGYPQLDRQLEQIRDCVAEGADALVIGAVSFEGAAPLLMEIAQDIPVIAAVNDIADEGIAAKAGVSWASMGAAAAEMLVRRHPVGGPPVQVAWFPGPRGAGWVNAVSHGLHEVLAGSSAEIVVEKWGDTGKEIQVALVEEALEEHPEIDYIIGTAPTAEAAVSILRARGLQDQIGVISDYMTHAVYRGIQRNKIIGAPTDFPVIQGQLAIEMAVRAIEGRLIYSHAGPRIQVVESGNVDDVGTTGSLAPATFTPLFQVP